MIISNHTRECLNEVYFSTPSFSGPQSIITAQSTYVSLSRVLSHQPLPVPLAITLLKLLTYSQEAYAHCLFLDDAVSIINFSNGDCSFSSCLCTSGKWSRVSILLNPFFTFQTNVLLQFINNHSSSSKGLTSQVYCHLIHVNH